MAKLTDYEAEAKKIYEGQYANKIQTLKNQQTAQNQQYKNDELSYNNLYDKYIKDNKTTGIANQNAYNNNVLARGLARSSIATTGLSGIKLATDKQEGLYNSERATKLQQLMQERNNYNQGIADQISALESEKASAIAEYARKLYEAQLDRELQIQLANMRSYGGGSGGYSSGGSSRNSYTDSEFRKDLKNEVTYANRSMNTTTINNTLQAVNEAHRQGLINSKELANYTTLLKGTINLVNNGGKNQSGYSSADRKNEISYTTYKQNNSKNNSKNNTTNKTSNKGNWLSNLINKFKK